MTVLEIRATVPETDYGDIAKIVSLVEREDVSVERLHNWDERLMEDDILEQYTGWSNGQIIGYCSAFRSVTAKIPKMNLIVIVHPSAEKQGYGSALYDHILTRAQHHQSTRLSAFVYEDRPHAVAFAEKRGFEIKHHTFNSVLDVTTFDTAPYAQLIQDVEAQGIRFSSLVAEGNNDATLRKLYVLNKRVAEDEPTHDGSSEHSYQTWKSYIAGADWFYPAGQLVALDGEDFVGLGAIGFNDDGRAFNAFTGILPDYRGRKLAQALKIKGIEFVQAVGGRVIETGNDSRNAAMLAINTKIGFVRQPGQYMVEREL